MNGSTELLDSPPRATAPAPVAPVAREIPRGAKLPLRTLLAVPVATALAFGLHLLVSQNELPLETHYYSIFLGGLFRRECAGRGGAAVVDRPARVAARHGPDPRRDRRAARGVGDDHLGPALAADALFSEPRGRAAESHRRPRRDLRQHLALAASCSSAATRSACCIGLITGVCIGWFAPARYWGMPVLKVVGPIPATAWIPLAMVVSPNATFSAIGLIALAVWFPVTMLTASGISNTRASYLDVARTLGAGRAYLIFRVAIPAAMPNIFIGLFMGLGASFLTLVVAETVGVKVGLGWYVQWAQGWAEYGKVYAALVIMAAFFSTIMTLLFKLRDRVLVWQKGSDQMVAARADASPKARRCASATSASASRRPTMPSAVARARSVVALGRRGRAGLARRPERLRQIHAAAADRRSRHARTPASCLVGTEPITGPSAERGLVFQDPNLFPWLTVRRQHRRPASSRAACCARSGTRWTSSCGSSASKASPTPIPHHLSGGMAQRVALARALINHPKVLLLDEPLGALDAFTRMRMQDEVLRLWQARGTTMLLVTHDIDEAIYMSDRIVIMTPRPGRIERIIPVELDRPRDRSSAEFLRLRGDILELLHFAGKVTT